MPVRQLLNTAYAAMAQNAKDLDELDRELCEEPKPAGEPSTRARAGLGTLMALGRMPQKTGAGS